MAFYAVALQSISIVLMSDVVTFVYIAGVAAAALCFYPLNLLTV